MDVAASASRSAYAHMAARIENIARLRLSKGKDITSGRILRARGASDAVARSAVAIAGKTGAIQADTGSRAAPYVRDAKLGLSNTHVYQCKTYLYK